MPTKKGLLFDADAQPLYFDTPGYYTCVPCGGILDTGFDPKQGNLPYL